MTFSQFFYEFLEKTLHFKCSHFLKTHIEFFDCIPLNDDKLRVNFSWRLKNKDGTDVTLENQSIETKQAIKIIFGAEKELFNEILE